ncbi:MAG: transcription termination factor NusA [Puniceicoccales bacterium]|jgi:N utilization substance protein A|nr:transcription termination factor NusA [Puniceicoccales bacterium]
MNQQILTILEYMEKEKGIPRMEMVRTISDAIVFAAQKSVTAGQNLEVSINPKTGALKAYSLLTAVDSVGDVDREIHIQRAREENPEIKIGDTVRREIDPGTLGRIAAQAARYAISQSVREHERIRVTGQYERHVGKIVSGTIIRKEIHESRFPGKPPMTDFVVSVDGTEGILAQRDVIPGEEFRVGNSVRALLVGLSNGGFGPMLTLSRTSPHFVAALLQLEISELADGTVEVVRLVRDAGYRTKIAVRSRDPRVDPVGSCVGSHGIRIKNIIKELSGEKIDVMAYSDDLPKFFQEALRPAIPQNVQIDAVSQRIRFEVPESDLALVIGRGGKNARLTSRLLNWRLDIATASSGQVKFDINVQKAVEVLNAHVGLPADCASRLVAIGITTPDALEGVTVADLVDAGLKMKDAVLALDGYKSYKKSKETNSSGEDGTEEKQGAVQSAV